MMRGSMLLGIAVSLAASGCVDRLILEDSDTFGASGGGDAGRDVDSRGDDAGGDDGGGDDGGVEDSGVEDDGGGDGGGGDDGEPPPCVDEPGADCDGDGVPDSQDPFPNDPTLPGRARDDVIYANTADALWVVSPLDWAPSIVGEFSFDTGGDQITDIAIDEAGFLYAVTTTGLFICNPDDAHCGYLFPLEGVNAAGYVPDDTTDGSTLYVAQFDGGWQRIVVGGGFVEGTLVGFLDGPSSGDIASFGGLTIVSVNDFDGFSTQIVDPITAQLLGPIGFTGFEIWGLASWGGIAIGFTPDGLVVGPDGSVFGQSENAWWGAAVHPDSAG